MNKLMIVEDESIVLEGMLKIIDFQSLGFEIVAVCRNGLEACEKYRQTKPDVVITDICMDIMDGLEFIETVKDEVDQTKFVIISGYQDFKFLKQAVRLKVTDYILKPVTPKEFRELLIKINKELRNGDKEEGMSNKETPSEVEGLAKSDFLNRLIHRKLSFGEITNKFTRFCLPFKGNYMQAMILQSNDTIKNETIMEITYNYIKQYCEEYEPILFVEAGGHVVILISAVGKEALKGYRTKLCEALNKELGGANLCCYGGEIVSSWVDINESFMGTNMLLVKGIIDNDLGYYDAALMAKKRKNSSFDFSVLTMEWIKRIMLDQEEAVEVLDELIWQAREGGLFLSDLKLIVENMINQLEHTTSYKIEDNIDFERCGSKVLIDYMKGVTKELIQKNKRDGATKDEYVMKQALKYIEENYHDTAFDLSKICKYLGVSASYFSALFKKNTKMTLIKYLNKYRVERAKEYLESTEYTISEISERVGYMDSHYFGIVFKKYTSSTPKAFRLRGRAR